MLGYDDVSRQADTQTPESARTRQKDDTALQRQTSIQTEQIRLLYANAPAGFVATVLNVIVLVLVQWRLIPTPILLAWLAYILTITLLRAGLVWQFQRTAPATHAMGLWGRLFGLGVGLAGLGWGSAGIFLFPMTSLPHQVFLTFVLGGMLAGAVGLLAARMQIFLSFLVPTALPMIVRFLIQADQLSLMMGGMATLFTVVTTFTAWKLHRAIHTSLHLRFDNADLLDAVTTEKLQVDHLNAQLTAEIAERQQAENALRVAQEALEERVRERTVALTTALAQLQDEIQGRQHLAEQLQQAQKMEAMGQLAGGIAHDFNNLLTVINGYSALALSTLPHAHPLRETLGHITEAGARASTLTSRLLAFSRRQVFQPQLLSFNRMITDLGHILTRVMGEDVQLDIQLHPDLWSIQADPAQLEHVLVNLAVNARDAMPHGGRVRIETANVTSPLPTGTMPEGARAGAYVMVALSDTGVGMSHDVKARLFEPFFTTKEVGKGTGLGLALVYGVVTQSGGHILVESAVGQGTTFRLYFPQATAEQHPPEPNRLADQWAGAETILLAEDEAVVRSLVEQVLCHHGYTVLTAENGETALQLAATYAAPIHLLLTDIVMPGISGRVLAEQLLVQRPAIKVLYMSGYTTDAVLQDGILHAGMHFLQKPFTPETLWKKLRELLDDAAASEDVRGTLP